MPDTGTPAETGGGSETLESFAAKKRQAVANVLGTFRWLRDIIRKARAPMGRDLASRPAALAGVKRAYFAVFDHFEAEVAAAEVVLAAAEGTYAAATQRFVDLRRQRDEAAAELYGLLAPLRRCLATLPVRGAGVSVTTPPPSEVPALLEQAAQTEELLWLLERDPPPPNRWLSLEAAPVAAELEGRRWRLEALLEEIEVTDAAVLPARKEAARALEEAGRVTSAVTGAMQGLAGLGEDARSASRLESGD